MRPLLLAASAALATVAALAPRPALALDHCGQVTTNQTWSSADNPHDICAEGVSIRNSTLRVLPGALVRFHEGANLVIESGAGMVAVGDAECAAANAATRRNPAPAYVARRADRWRYNVVLRGPDPLTVLDPPPGSPWSVDVDPESLL